MSHYAKSARPARTFTPDEARRLMDTSGKHMGDYRDHMIFAVGFGMGLRVHEVAALTVGDVFHGDGGVRSRVALRVFKGCQRDGGTQEARVCRALAYKLAKFRTLKARLGESVDAGAPLFMGRKGGHLTDRHCRRLLKKWLEAAGLDPTLHFHEIRHTAISDYIERNPDRPFQAQNFGRHKDLRTTLGYAHLNERGLDAAIQGQFC